MSLQYGEVWPTITAEIGWWVWGTPANINGFASWLRYCTASLNGGQPNFAPCSAVSWAYIYIFWGLLSPNGILPGAKFTLCPSLAFSYIDSVTAWHDGTRSLGLRQTLRLSTRNGITELSLLVIFNRGRHLYSQSGILVLLYGRPM